MKLKKALEDFEKLIVDKNSIYWISFLWGISEGVFFFIIPDVLLSFIALYSLKKGMKSSFIVLLGSLSGAIVAYYFVAPNVDITQFLLSIPLINKALLVKALEHLQIGAKGVVLGPITGTPHKAYSMLAWQLHIPIVPYLFYSAISRWLRFLLVVTGIHLTHSFVRKDITKSKVFSYALLLLFWLFVYVAYYILVESY